MASFTVTQQFHQEVAGLEGTPTPPKLLGKRFLLQSRRVWLVTTIPDQAVASSILLSLERREGPGNMNNP